MAARESSGAGVAEPVWPAANTALSGDYGGPDGAGGAGGAAACEAGAASFRSLPSAVTWSVHVPLEQEVARLERMCSTRSVLSDYVPLQVDGTTQAEGRQWG